MEGDEPLVLELTANPGTTNSECGVEARSLRCEHRAAAESWMVAWAGRRAAGAAGFPRSAVASVCAHVTDKSTWSRSLGRAWPSWLPALCGEAGRQDRGWCLPPRRLSGSVLAVLCLAFRMPSTRVCPPHRGWAAIFRNASHLAKYFIGN